MSKVQMLRALVNQRLTAAAEEIFGLFERTIAEHEEELCRSKEENERHRKLLDAVFKPEVRLHRADVQQLLVRKEEVPPEQQQWRPSLDQEDPPEPPHIKEEQEELWTSQEGPEEADVTTITFSRVPVKSEEDDEDKPQSSQLHQSQTGENREAEHLKTEADGEDCGGPEPARNPDPDTPLQAATHDNTSHSEPETDDSCDWEETREPQSGSNPLQHNQVPVSDQECNSGTTSVSSSEGAASFGHKEHLQEHTGVQTGGKPFSCSVCGKRFTQRGHLKVHARIHTGEKPFSCSVCSKRFTQKGTLKVHARIHTRKKPFSSSVCSKILTEKGTLKEHFKINTVEKPFNCLVRGQSFSRKRPLTEHLTVNLEKEEQEELWTSQEGPEEADVTTITFSRVPVKSEEDDEEKPQSSQLHQSQTGENREAEHLKTEADGEDCGGPEPARNPDPDSPLQAAAHDNTSHSEPETDDTCDWEPETDDTCDWEPETDDSCDWEETREPQSGSNPLQHNQGPVSDQECNSGTTSVSSSEGAASFGHKEHLQEHTGVKTGRKTFSCSVCGRRFTHKGTLKVHMRIHTGEKPFSCSDCGKRFREHGNLRNHIRIHTGEKPFNCSVCGQGFTEHGNLRNHIRIHTGEKPFSCSVCGKTFTRQHHLKLHLRTHTGEKPFSCSVCGQKFPRKDTLTQHLRTHTGKKPFSCSVCGQRFSLKGNLKQHLRVHPVEKQFSCSTCDKRFVSLQSVQKHKCAGESSRDKGSCLLSQFFQQDMAQH